MVFKAGGFVRVITFALADGVFRQVISNFTTDRGSIFDLQFVEKMITF
jgi:hypothetical protein